MAASGMNGESGQQRRGALFLALAWLATFLVFAGIVVAIALFGDPYAGQKAVTLEIPAPPVAQAKPPATAPVAPPAETLPPETPPAGAAPTETSPEQTAGVPTPEPAPPKPAPPPPVAPGNLAIANPALIEKTPQGPLPRIADNGLSPMRGYGVVIPADGRPRIAIVIRGLGISAKATAYAIAHSPPGVTLAFAPYANDVQNWVSLARKNGHEVLLEVPMEPYDFPDSDPGRYTLRAGVDEDANTRKLVWSLTRFTGYVGVTNLLGGKLLSDADALQPILTYLNRRGLLFFDNGSAMHSVAPEVAARIGLPFAQATLTIDSIQSAMEIDHRLSDLEKQARKNGTAVGAGFLYPVTLDRVTRWAKGLPGRGFVLAPISAIVTSEKKKP